MMDLKEIIKWFIPCFHILLAMFKLKELKLTFVCLFLLFNFHVGCAANASGVGLVENDAKNVDSLIVNKINQSEVLTAETTLKELPEFPDGSVGRTFGRPFKKMMGALLPLVFQIGAASTWAVVAALVGVKTLAVTLIILKILLIAGAAKVGALFGSKGQGHYSQGWEPPHHPQKEIHLHIHNGGGNHEVHEEHPPSIYGGWSREDATHAIDPKTSAVATPYSIGPQTIKTPFGNYVKVDSNEPSYTVHQN